MPKIVYVFMIMIFVSGCSFLPGFSSKAAKGKPTNSLEISKKEAIGLAKDFVTEQGFDDKFRAKKPVKIKRRVTLSSDPQWVWRVYFAAKTRKFWKFWKRAPLMIEVNAETGLIDQWGRR